MAIFCTKCGAQNDDLSHFCAQCQAELPVIKSQQTYQPPSGYSSPFESGYQPIQPPAPLYGDPPPLTDWNKEGADKKIIAGILGIVAGAFGIHKFILGYQKEGLTMLLVSLLSCGTLAGVMHIIGIVEGIIYLTQTDEDFVRTYLHGHKGWF